MTVQNEPMAVQTWESCNYTAEEERDFVKNYLGPTLAKAGLGDKKIMIWDHNRNLMYQRARWCSTTPRPPNMYGAWPSIGMWEIILKTLNGFTKPIPKVHLMFTEGCRYPFDMAKSMTGNGGNIYGNP